MLKAIDPASLVSVAILPLMNTMAISFACLPLAEVRVSEDTAPHTVAVLHASVPLSIIYLSIDLMVLVLAMRLSLDQRSRFFPREQDAVAGDLGIATR